MTSKGALIRIETPNQKREKRKKNEVLFEKTHKTESYCQFNQGKKKTTQIEKLEDKKKAVIATFRQNNIKSSRCQTEWRTW